MPPLTDDQARERAAALDGWELAGGAIRKQYNDSGGLTERDFRLARKIDG